MTCKQGYEDYEVGDEVIMQNDEVVYTIVFMNKGARNVTLRNPQKNSYKFGVPFTDIRPAPSLTPLCEVKLCKFGRGDRVTLNDVNGFDLFDVVDIEFAIPEGYMCKLESVGGYVGGWYPESDLTLYATKETLESLKEINAATPKVLSGIPGFGKLGEIQTISSGVGVGSSMFEDSAIAEAYSFDPEESLAASVKPYRKHIDIQEALGILMEATRIQMEYITRNPDPKCTPELIAANRVLARIHAVTK